MQWGRCTLQCSAFLFKYMYRKQIIIDLIITCSGLIKGIDSLCMYFNGDGVVTESLGKFGNVLEEALSYFMVRTLKISIQYGLATLTWKDFVNSCKNDIVFSGHCYILLYRSMLVLLQVKMIPLLIFLINASFLPDSYGSNSIFNR